MRARAQACARVYARVCMCVRASASRGGASRARPGRAFLEPRPGLTRNPPDFDPNPAGVPLTPLSTSPHASLDLKKMDVRPTLGWIYVQPMDGRTSIPFNPREIKEIPRFAREQRTGMGVRKHAGQRSSRRRRPLGDQLKTSHDNN